MKYKYLEIDHISVIVKPGFPEKNEIKCKNLIGHRKYHSGQGTAAEFIVFEENYLEFIWASDNEELKKCDIHLYNRFTNINCPFAISYRGNIEEKFKSDFIEYRPKYLPSGRILKHFSYKENLTIPFIFVMDVYDTLDRYWPKYNERFNIFDLRKGGVKQIVIHTPYPNEIYKNFPQITQVKSDIWKLEIHGLESFDFSPFNFLTMAKEQD
ncbi:MAG: hypothetical protein H6622_16000 [Halobacteriovoraceae bacterium]|nr:hypothetical protein [Halobacteriovoraceae bacterium]